MKRKAANFILTIFTMGLLAGCAGEKMSPMEEARQTTEGTVTTGEQNSEDGDTGGQVQKDGTTVAPGAQTGEKQSAEAAEEPYVVSFEATTVEGEEITSEIFADSKLTMLNVWATYCNPCLQEMPDLGEIAAAYDMAEFQMIGIVSDVAEGAAEEDIEYVKDLIAQTNATYPNIILSESLYRNLVGAVEAVPTTFFVNSKGELLGYTVGTQSKEAWEELINQILAE